MPGTKSSGRPGGNPDIKKYGFKKPPGRDRAFTKVIPVAVTEEIKQELQEKLGKGKVSEFCREAIFEKMRAEGMTVDV
jgi:hypothetical protein